MAVSEDENNVYVVWWTNRSGNWEVMFRASNDGGATFGDKTNLSNSPGTESGTAEIVAAGFSSLFVSWWELNENVHPHTNESVMRVSTDAGQTFGAVVNLGINGTITTSDNSTTLLLVQALMPLISFLHVAEGAYPEEASTQEPSSDEERKGIWRRRLQLILLARMAVRRERQATHRAGKTGF